MLDLNKFANRLLNPERSEIIRALDLYQLQAAVFLQKKTQRDHARKYCAMMLMDHIEERDGIRKGDLGRAASLSEYGELFNEIMRERGWIGLCRLRGPHSFEIKLQHGIQNSKFLADAVDLVCRYAQDGGQRLSLALAEQVSRGRLKEVEPRGREPVNSVARNTEEAVLIYLLLTRCSELLPPALRQDSFAEHLLPQVRDIATLRKLFSAYNCVSRLLLPPAQQSGRPLMLQGDEAKTSIQWKPLDVETKKLIDRYAKAGLQPLR